MTLNTDELCELADKLSSPRLAALEKELAEKKRETDYWRQRCEEAERRVEMLQARTGWSPDCVTLSMEKIRTFAGSLRNMERWAFLRQFVQWTLSEELAAKEMPMLESLMPLPDEKTAEIHNHFGQDAKCQVFNAKVTGNFE